MDCCQQVIIPSEKLKKLNNILKIICIINIILPIINGIILNKVPNSSFGIFMSTFFLLFAITSGFYLYIVLYIFFTLIDSVYYFIYLGGFIQMVIQNKTIDYKKLILYPINVIFYIFAIFVSFQSYKEMKGILLEGGVAQNQNDTEQGLNPNYNDNTNNNTNTNTNTNNRFVPFSGRGVVVGGNWKNIIFF